MTQKIVNLTQPIRLEENQIVKNYHFRPITKKPPQSQWRVQNNLSIYIDKRLFGPLTFRVNFD